MMKMKNILILFLIINSIIYAELIRPENGSELNYIYVLSKTEDESNNKTNVGGLMFNVGLGIKL